MVKAAQREDAVPRSVRPMFLVVATVTSMAVSAQLGFGPTESALAATVIDPASTVNPLLGTTHAGDTFPGADTPFGMVQWSPDTPARPDGGGYSYSDSTITGFSLTHMSGPGCKVMGDIPVLPTVGAANGTATVGFSHADESASAGL